MEDSDHDEFGATDEVDTPHSSFSEQIREVSKQEAATEEPAPRQPNRIWASQCSLNNDRDRGGNGQHQQRRGSVHSRLGNNRNNGMVRRRQNNQPYNRYDSEYYRVRDLRRRVQDRLDPNYINPYELQIKTAEKFWQDNCGQIVKSLATQIIDEVKNQQEKRDASKWPKYDMKAQKDIAVMQVRFEYLVNS